MMSDAKQNLIDRGWTEDGAQFLIDTLNEWTPAIQNKILGTKNQRTVKEQCSKCGYRGPALDWHHVDGRKKSDRTIVLCANCHREAHAGSNP